MPDAFHDEKGGSSQYLSLVNGLIAEIVCPTGLYMASKIPVTIFRLWKIPISHSFRWLKKIWSLKKFLIKAEKIDKIPTVKVDGVLYSVLHYRILLWEEWRVRWSSGTIASQSYWCRKFPGTGWAAYRQDRWKRPSKNTHPCTRSPLVAPAADLAFPWTMRNPWLPHPHYLHQKSNQRRNGSTWSHGLSSRPPFLDSMLCIGHIIWPKSRYTLRITRIYHQSITTITPIKIAVL